MGESTCASGPSSRVPAVAKEPNVKSAGDGRDRRTLALLIFQPLLLLVIFGYAASFDVSEVDAAV